MFAGEFASLSTMHALMPQSCPCPRGWGEYRTSPGTYFVVMDFLYLITELPAPERISGLIAGLHKTTAGTSPNNMFGFHVPTCHGKIAQPNDWDQDWSRFYAKLLRVFYDEDIKSNGEFPEYEKAFVAFEEHVIPRLLKPLQAEGRVLIPCLVHGDLWQENMGTNEETEDLMLYDPALFYGHNEFEIGMWRTNSVPFDETYRRHYLELIPPSEPANEWDDRNRLYSVFYHMSQSAHWVGAAKETRIRYVAYVFELDSTRPITDPRKKACTGGTRN
ncbi:hypothetical protein GQ53DRAFT_746716 [Thozetella sp. PMI_491]|nr:hypothetical protein GQ53DRAFT_746716 [Thozetella sp. PMI_491]